MSMHEFESAVAIIHANPKKAFFAGPRSNELLCKMENIIGYKFPPTYRLFLSEFGAGNFGPMEFLGVIDDDIEESSVPDGVWYTLTERREVNLPQDLFVVGETGMGELYCLRLNSTGTEEGPVLLINPGCEPGKQICEEVAPDFGTFFLNSVKQAGSNG